MNPRPSIDVAVIMRRERLASRWQPWRWVLDDVMLHEPAFGTEPRLLVRDDAGERWLHPGFTVELFRDDTEGYELNLTSGAPCWFVLWRMQEAASAGAEAMPRPVTVTLSYNDAGRWLDAQETVEQVPAPPDIVEWLRAFNAEHHVAEPKRRRRPQSFRPLQDRFGNPAAITTEKKFEGGGNE
jgi:hypothetical protein